MTGRKLHPDDWPAIIREINLPVRALAKRTGIDPGTISRLARGEIRDPLDSTARTLRRLRDSLRTSNERADTTPAIAPSGASDGIGEHGGHR